MSEEKTTIEIEALKDLHATIERQAAEIARLRAGAMSEEVRIVLDRGLEHHWFFAITSMKPGEFEREKAAIRSARHWLESQPTATCRMVCPYCGCNEFYDCTISGHLIVGHCNACGNRFTGTISLVISSPREMKP